MEHSFDVEIAKQYGINAAILLKNIYFWVCKNKANNKHFYEGKYWTYNSTKAFEELFPYLGARQIRGALKVLEDNGIICTGEFNEIKYDRTKWYAITEKGFALVEHRDVKIEENGVVDPFVKMTNGDDIMTNGLNQKVEPIPDSKPDSKPDSNNIINENFENLWAMLEPTQYDRKLKVSAKRKKELFEMGKERAEKAINLYLRTKNREYTHRRDNFLNEIIDNYLDKKESDFDKHSSQSRRKPSLGDDFDTSYDLEAYEAGYMHI